MLKNLIPYMVKYYVRTFKYVPIVLIFMVVLGTIYWQKNVPIWNTYSFTINVIFIFSAWISIGFFDVEDNIQQQLVFLRFKKKTLYHLSKIFTIWVISFVFIVFIVLYPIFRNLFNRPITGFELILTFIIHIFISLLGISITALFNSKVVPDRRIALGGLFIIIILSVVQVPIIKEFSFVRYITWIFPPISFITEKIITFDGLNIYSITMALIVGVPYIILYAVILLLLYIKLMKKKMF